MDLVSTEKVFVKFDPRIKLYILIVLSFVMPFSAQNDGSPLRLAGAALVFLFLLNMKNIRLALTFIVVYFLFLNSSILQQYVEHIYLLSVCIRFFELVVCSMLPITFFAYYVLSTTKINEFLLAMKKLKISDKIAIPFAVMFRFFPALKKEYFDIQDAMKLRGVVWSGGPIKMIEYRFVPLLISLVKVGEELSAAALTRGLGADIKRTNYFKIGLHLQDFIIFVVVTILLVLFLI